jgi:hypothetical protein
MTGHATQIVEEPRLHPWAARAVLLLRANLTVCCCLALRPALEVSDSACRRHTHRSQVFGLTGLLAPLTAAGQPRIFTGFP